MLAFLLVNARRAVSNDALLDAVWHSPGTDPAAATKRLQMAIARLRRSLAPLARDGDAESVVRTVSGGYMLVVAPGELDSDVFAARVQEGRRALQADELEPAATVLREALELWRGPVLADVAFEDFAQPEIRRLDELRLVAIETRVEADLLLGRHEALVGELEALAVRHATHERVVGQLMLALYRCGRQSDALNAFQRARAHLASELGLEPGPDLRRLHEAILRQDPGLAEVRAAPAARVAAVAGPAPRASAGWASRLPLPPRLQGANSIGYVARDDERARATRCWDAVLGGGRRTVLICGEPGIGKTRFATHMALQLHAQGAAVIFGHSTEELATPYGSFVEALSHVVDHAPAAALAAHVERYGGELLRLVRTLKHRVPGTPDPTQSDPETERYLLFAAVAGLLKQLSEDAPLVFVVDDLHWADPQSLALLRHVISDTVGTPLLVLGTYRDGDLSRRQPLLGALADLAREPGIERLALEGLDEGAVAALMELAVGHELDAGSRAVAHAIAGETDGNPFFVGEMLRHLAESGALARAADGRWSVRCDPEVLGLPQAVREVVLGRLARLGDECHEVLTSAAVIGRDFDLEVLAGVAHRDEDTVLDVLDTAVQASLLKEQSGRAGSFSFAHSLINRTIYTTLGGSRRARLHRRVAEALEARNGQQDGGHVAQLARQWAAAGPGGAAKALAYSRQAGEHALSSLAPDEALRWFGEALELLDKAPVDDPAMRCDIHIGIGEAQRQTGQQEFGETLLLASRLAEELGDPERAARAALANNRGFASTFGVVDAERVAALDRAIEFNRDAHPARRARLLALQAMELQFDGDHERRRALADRALGLARDAGDLRTLFYVLRDHFHAVWSADTLSVRQRTARELAKLADGIADPLAKIWALDRSIHVAIEAGEGAAARAASQRLVEKTESLGQPGLRWHAAYFAAGLVLLSGDLEEGDRLIEAAAARGQAAGEPDAGLVYLSQHCAVRVEQGRAADVLPILEAAVTQFPGIPAFEAGFTVGLCELGREREAESRLHRALRADFAPPRDQVYTTALAMWARAVAHLGAKGAAPRLYDLIAPWRELVVWNGGTGYGSLESYLGMLAATMGFEDRAAEHIGAAEEVHRRAGMKGWDARHLGYWARAALANGNEEHARALAQQALRTAEDDGWAGAARQATRVLEACAHAESTT